jgi:hypothetical protein
MGSLYIKGSKLWARYKDELGKWKGAPTPYRQGDDAKARRFLKSLEAESEAKRQFVERDDAPHKGPITVAAYAAVGKRSEAARVGDRERRRRAPEPARPEIHRRDGP